MLKAVLLFAVGLICLIKGGDWFVDGATGIAHELHIPEILIGATIVSIGTTLPEVMVSATSAVSGHGEIAYGNAIGSIICNTALIAALTIAIKPSYIKAKTLKIPVGFFFAAAVFYSAIAYSGTGYTRTVGIILLAMFIAYMVFSVYQALGVGKKTLGNKLQDEALLRETEESLEDTTNMPVWKMILLLAVGAALIAAGADLLVDNGTIIAEGLGVPESVIALTFVALGTSLPELITAITSLLKGHSALSLGNIIGANLFNLVLVSGLSITLSPFDLPAGKTIAGINASLLIDIPVMFAVMLIMTIPALTKGKLSRAQGIILLCIYTAFVVFQFVN